MRLHFKSGAARVRCKSRRETGGFIPVRRGSRGVLFRFAVVNPGARNACYLGIGGIEPAGEASRLGGWAVGGRSVDLVPIRIGAPRRRPIPMAAPAGRKGRSEARPIPNRLRVARAFAVVASGAQSKRATDDTITAIAFHRGATGCGANADGAVSSDSHATGCEPKLWDRLRTSPSLPGLTRQPALQRRGAGCRVKPGNDGETRLSANGERRRPWSTQR